MAGQGGHPITVPPPAHVHAACGFSSQEQATVQAMGSQLGQHPPLLSMDSGVGLNSGFPGQHAADFSAASLGSHNGFSNQDFRSPLSTGDLCLQLPPQDAQGVHGQMFSPTSPNTIPGIMFYNDSGIEEHGPGNYLYQMG